MVNKIVLFNLYLKAAKKNPHTFEERPQIYTNDKQSVELQFNALDTSSVELGGASATILLFMGNGSFFQKTDVVRQNNTFTYVMKSNETKHSGIAKVQLVVEMDGVEIASPLYEIRVIGGLETKPIQEVEIQDWTTLTAEAKAFVEQIEGFTLEQFVENKMGEELANLEVNYATRLTGLETADQNLTAQLAQMASVVFNQEGLNTALSEGVKTINIGSGITLDNDIIIPKGVTIKFNQEGALVIQPETTLTINGYIDAPYRPIFSGEGDINGSPSNSRLISAWFGLLPDEGAETNQQGHLNYFLDIANKTRTEAFVLKGRYFVTEIDLSVFLKKGGLTLVGEGKQNESKSAEFVSVDSTQIQNPLKAFMFVNDKSSGNTNRNITVHNIGLYDDSVEPTPYGLYSYGTAQNSFKNIMTNGFKTGVFLDQQWNCEYEHLSVYHFKEHGLMVGSEGVANATSFQKLHLTSNVPTAQSNIFLDGNRSFIFYELTSEGSAETHVKMGRSAESFIVFGWHTEGGKHLFELTGYDSKRTNIEVYGGNLFLSSRTSDSEARLIKCVDFSGVGGLSALTLRGSMRLRSSTNPNYLSLGKVYNTNAMLNFGVPSPPVDFINLGKDLGRTAIATAHIPPIGYFPADYPLRKGTVGNYETSVRLLSTSTNSSPAKVFKLKEPRELKRVSFDIQVLNVYDSGAFASMNDYADFKVTISSDGTLSQKTINSEGSYSEGVIFTWDNTNQELRVKTESAVGSFDFYINAHVSLI